jgi:hypothetical protein
MEFSQNIIQLKKFFEKYQPLYSISFAMYAQQERISAPRFSIFQFFSINENRISDIIATFLDPKGTHGQQSLFLELFLKQVTSKIQKYQNFKAKNIESSIVVREALTDMIDYNTRRIDILLIGANWVLGIENKIFAGESDNQLLHYTNQIDAKYGNKELCEMIFLNLNNVQSESHKGSREPILMGYNRGHSTDDGLYLSDWLELCKNSCKIDKIRQFLDDFLLYVQTKLS